MEVFPIRRAVVGAIIAADGYPVMDAGPEARGKESQTHPRPLTETSRLFADPARLVDSASGIDLDHLGADCDWYVVMGEAS